MLCSSACFPCVPKSSKGISGRATWLIWQSRVTAITALRRKKLLSPPAWTKLTAAQRALAELYEISEALIAAAARSAPSLPEREDSAKQHAAWLERQPEATQTASLAQL